MTSRHVPTNRRGRPVFRRGNRICSYGGTQVSDLELSARYDLEGLECVAPYAVRAGPDTVVDAACMRDAGAYANDSFNSPVYNAELHSTHLRAIRDIYQGDEICIAYGPEYWANHDEQPTISHTRRQRRRANQAVAKSRQRGRMVTRP